MKSCNRCGEEIGFKRVAGRWTPTNADGSEHKCAVRAKKPARKDHEKSKMLGTSPPAGCKFCVLPWDEPCETCPARLDRPEPAALDL